MRFDEAIESHQKAVNALNETLHGCINNAKIFESIKLQRDFQMKNIELVRLKKTQYEKYKTAIEQQRLKNFNFLEQRIVKDGNVCDLQISIFKALEESDTLLDLLGEKRSSPESQPNVVGDESESLSDNANVNKPKTIKSNDTIIDDMHKLNHQLHILVFNLVNRIDDSAHELDALRDRIKGLEKNDRQYQRKPSSATNTAKPSSESSSKYDESSYDHENQRTSISGEERKIVLPESSDLPPLELPDFDYNF